MSVSGSGGGRNFVSANLVPREEPCPFAAVSVIAFLSDHGTATGDITRRGVDGEVHTIAARPDRGSPSNGRSPARPPHGRLEEIQINEQAREAVARCDHERMRSLSWDRQARHYERSSTTVRSP
jgi:hypothetical protein